MLTISIIPKTNSLIRKGECVIPWHPICSGAAATVNMLVSGTTPRATPKLHYLPFLLDPTLGPLNPSHELVTPERLELQAAVRCFTTEE